MEILKIIDFFVAAARNDLNFLSIILEANILGLLRPFLEFELRNTKSPILQHGSERFMVYDERDLQILTVIRERGLLELLSDISTSDVGLRRGILSRAFDVILQKVFLIQIGGDLVIEKRI